MLQGRARCDRALPWTCYPYHLQELAYDGSGARLPIPRLVLAPSQQLRIQVEMDGMAGGP